MAGAHLSAILFWSACSGRGVAAWKRLEGLSGSSASWALNTPRNRRSYLSHLARSASSSFTSPLPPFAISYAISPPFFLSISFLSSRKILVSGKQWSSCHFCFSRPPLPQAIVADPSFVCFLRLLLKIKNNPFHPLYCFLVGCPWHSLGFFMDIQVVSPFKG